jgi:phytoene dehydrogenase-like protein
MSFHSERYYIIYRCLVYTYFLKISTIITHSSLLQLHSPYYHTMNQSLDVIIIGAGIAGLAAAQKLVKNGNSVKIVEARTRIGGRVFPQEIGANLLDDDKQLDYPAITVECGANWIHGLDDSNPIYCIAKKCGWDLVRSTGDDDIDTDAMIADREYYEVHGTPRLYSKSELEHAADYLEQMQRMLDKSRRNIGKKKASVRYNTTVRDVLLRTIESMSADRTKSVSPLINWLYEQQGIAEAKDLDMIR